MKTGWSILAVWIGLTAVVARAWQEDLPTGAAYPKSVRHTEAVVELTLDDGIQHVVERALDAAMTDYRPDAAWAIVEKVGTGEILAMAARSNDGSGQAVAGLQSARMNIAAEMVFEPGSIFAVGIVAAALNEGLVRPDSVFDVGHGAWHYGGHVLHDKVYGRVDVRTILKKSSNIGAAMIGLLLGNRRMECYLRGFGFGSPLGIDLPGEERGLLTPSARWATVTPTRIAIGQGISVTALQMLNAYCTIANGGRLMRPYVVSKVVSPRGETILENAPKVIGRPIRPEIAAQVREMLVAVTEEGTGRRAAVEGYTIAGKTGTAQQVVDGAYSQTDYWASFVGFVPAEDPVFGMIVIIDRPRGLRTGGAVSAPVFSRLALVVARYLEIPVVVPADAAHAGSESAEAPEP